MGGRVGGWVGRQTDRRTDLLLKFSCIIQSILVCLYFYSVVQRWHFSSPKFLFTLYTGLTVLLPYCVVMTSPSQSSQTPSIVSPYRADSTITLFHRDGKPPKFLEKPSIRQEGGCIIMSILLEAKPEPKVTWFRGATALSSGGRIVIRREAGSAADSYRLILEVSVSRSRGLYQTLLKIIYDN